MALSKPPKQPSTLQSQVFDYAALGTEIRIVVQQRTSEIKSLMRRSAQDIIDIGQKLIEVKDQLGHGEFGKWLRAEFAWSEQTARQFMHVASWALQTKSTNFVDLSIAASALYLLAAPSTPNDAREEALERANLGETINHSKAKEIVGKHKESDPPKASKPVTVDVRAEAVEKKLTIPDKPDLAQQTNQNRLLIDSPASVADAESSVQLGSDANDSFDAGETELLEKEVEPESPLFEIGSFEYELNQRAKQLGLLHTDVCHASLADVDFVNSFHELSEEHIIQLFESMDDEALEFFINKSAFLYETAKEVFSKRHNSSYFGHH